MINPKFHFLLGEPKGPNRRALWTVAKMAEKLYVNRAHLTDVLNNKPEHGAQTRPKVVKFLKLHFESRLSEILQSLGWDEDGNIITETTAVPRPTFHKEHMEEKA